MIPGTVSIHRRSDDTVCVEIRDELSRTKFVEATMTMEAFAYAVTGLAERPAELEVRGLENVGKRKIGEKRQIACPLRSWSTRLKLEQWLAKHAQEDGWILNTSLGSQDSVQDSMGDGCVLNYSVYKYVEEP
jgi:hypothetical protein